MAIRKSSSSGIPFGNTAGRPANPTLGQLYSNGQVGRLELYTSTGWQNIVQETPGIAGVTGTYNESAGSGTFVISGTNFVDGGIVYAVGTNAVEYQATTSTYNSIVQMTVLFTGLSPAYEPYDVKVVNPSNLFGLLPDAFFINDSPVWSTTAGSLGTWAGSNIQLSATDDESNTITYTVTSGSLPSGLSLSSAGLISGTTTASGGTYTFTVSASDGSNTAVTRSFSIIIPFPIVSGGTLSSDATYYYRTFTGTSNLVVSTVALTADVLTIAGGGAGGRYGGGGGAGGIVYHASQSLSPATISITVGGGAPSHFGDAQLGGQAPSGNPSQVGSLQQAYGGGGGGLYQNNGGYNSSGANGGSGGGGAVTNGSNGTRNAGSSTQVGVGATAFYGNNGGAGAVGAGSGAAGGGGAGGVGGNAGTGAGGAGGIGISIYSSWGLATSTGHNVSGTVYYGGGGGGASSGGGALSLGGLGGGGKGASTDTAATTVIDGLASTGGGGGGNPDQYVSSVWRTGAGGSGVVIVRYTKASVGG